MAISRLTKRLLRDEENKEKKGLGSCFEILGFQSIISPMARPFRIEYPGKKGRAFVILFFNLTPHSVDLESQKLIIF